MTREYYQINAQDFYKNTVEVNMSSLYEKYLPRKTAILDVVCGSGRDTKAFLELGYDVD